MNFNCASDTCSLVAVMSVRTSHWYHAGCGMKMKLVRLGFRSKGGDAATGMHFLHWMSACFRDVWVCETVQRIRVQRPWWKSFIMSGRQKRCLPNSMRSILLVWMHVIPYFIFSSVNSSAIYFCSVNSYSCPGGFFFLSHLLLCWGPLFNFSAFHHVFFEWWLPF